MLTAQKYTIAVGLALAFAIPVSADVINTDLKTLKDKLVISDTDTGLEFLKLTETLNVSVNDVKSRLNTTYLGWRLANEAEVSSLLGNLLNSTINSVGLYDEINGATSISNNDLYLQGDILGFSDVSNYRRSYGFVTNNIETHSSMYGFWYRELNNTASIYRDHSQYSNSSVITYFSTWLVRDSVDASLNQNDVATPLSISGLATLFFLFSRRKSKQQKSV